MWIHFRLRLCSLRFEYTSRQPLLDMARILARLELAFAKLTTLTLRQELKELLERTRNPALSERGMISILTVSRAGQPAINRDELPLDRAAGH